MFEKSNEASPRKVRLLSAWTNIYAPDSKIRGRKAKIDDNIKRKLDRFLSRNDISFTLPDRNNQVYVGKGDDGKSKYETKKYLLWTFLELATLLKQEDDNISSMSFTMLYRYISSHKEYVGRSKILEVNCLCPVCENLELLWTGIKKNCSDIDFPTKSHDFLEEVSCKPITQVCVDKKCKSCPSLDTDAINDCETIAFYMWKKRDKYYEKVLCEQTGEEIYNMLETQIDEIQEHYYRKHTQDAAYQAQMDEPEEGEVVIHVNYSENFKKKQQNEIKGGYYGQCQFSYFTVVVYIKEGDLVCKNYALATPEKTTSATSVLD